MELDFVFTLGVGDVNDFLPSEASLISHPQTPNRAVSISLPLLSGNLSVPSSGTNQHWSRVTMEILNFNTPMARRPTWALSWNLLH